MRFRFRDREKFELWFRPLEADPIFLQRVYFYSLAKTFIGEAMQDLLGFLQGGWRESWS
jgi:hypothetical protein